MMKIGAFMDGGWSTVTDGKRMACGGLERSLMVPDERGPRELPALKVSIPPESAGAASRDEDLRQRAEPDPDADTPLPRSLPSTMWPWVHQPGNRNLRDGERLPWAGKERQPPVGKSWWYRPLRGASTQPSQSKRQEHDEYRADSSQDQQPRRPVAPSAGSDRPAGGSHRHRKAKRPLQIEPQVASNTQEDTDSQSQNGAVCFG